MQLAKDGMTIVRADLADAEAIWAVERQQLLDDLAAASVQQTTAETLLAEERRKSQGPIPRVGMQWQYDSGQGSWCSFAIDANEQLLMAYCNGSYAVDVLEAAATQQSS